MCITCGCDSELEPSSHSHDHRTISLEEKILQKNDAIATENRTLFKNRQLQSFNLLSSPGSGKTTLLEKTLQALLPSTPCYVIEGDQQTDQDAVRIRATGAPAVQINTGKGCHLDAHQLSHAIEKLDLPDIPGYVFIENVGNLVCPASFDLGEDKKIVILSVTEGDDKPIKYPDMFNVADLMIINKIDLLPYVNFDIEKCITYAHRVNSQLEVIQLSSTTLEGFDQWLDWLLGRK